MSNQPYVDVARDEKQTKEFSLHKLSWDHLVVIHQALKKFSELADNDLQLFAERLIDLKPAECELLVDYCYYRKLALDLKDCMEDVA